MNTRRGFWIYLLAVTYLCLFPWQFDPSLDKPMYMWPSDSRRVIVVDAILNLGLLMPLGILGRLAYPGLRGFLTVIGIAAIWTFGVEALQTMLPSRTSSIADVSTNLAGAIIGLFVAPLLVRHLLLPAEESRQVRWDTRALFLIGCFLVGEIFPFIPNLRITQIRALAAALPDGAGLMEILTAGISGLLVTLLARSLTHPAMPSVAAFGLAVALLLARAPFPSGVHPGVVVLAGIVGASIGSTTPIRLLWRHLWVLLLAYLALRQLSPFTFTPQSAAFSWQPFAQLMDLPRATAIRILFEKLFVYGSALHVLYQRSESWILSMLPCILLLALGEWVQRWIPGRTPDSLDPLLVILVALALLLLPGFPVGDRNRPSPDEHPG